MKNKVDKEEVDQLKEEIGSIRKGQKQALGRAMGRKLKRIH